MNKTNSDYNKPFKNNQNSFSKPPYFNDSIFNQINKNNNSTNSAKITSTHNTIISSRPSELGQPVKSLQTFLRRIAQHYNSIPLVIPDGTFGKQTKSSVLAFQKQFNLPQTGIVDYVVWNKIVSVFNEIMVAEYEAFNARIFPITKKTIGPPEKSYYLYAIQGMLYSLTIFFQNIGKLNISGIYDNLTIQVIKNIQQLTNLNTTGIIDKPTWNNISKLYDSFITGNTTEL